MEIATVSWLALGFGLGLVHAFDADHVMALSVFASKGRSASDGVRAGLRWSLGHGLVLIAAGVGLLLLGWALPPGLALAAERVVGAVMIALGVWVWAELARQRSHLHYHEHDDLPSHMHWHSHSDDLDGHGASETQVVDGDASTGSRLHHAHHAEHGHDHGPLFVGGLHGLAGSAPILAVLPVATQSPMLGVGYLFLFAFGVSLAMAIVSGALGHLSGRLIRHENENGLIRLRALSASGSIALGGWMLVLS